MIRHHGQLGWLLTCEEWLSAHMKCCTAIGSRPSRDFAVSGTNHPDGDGRLVQCPCGSVYITNRATLATACYNHDEKMGV